MHALVAAHFKQEWCAYLDQLDVLSEAPSCRLLVDTLEGLFLEPIASQTAVVIG